MATSESEKAKPKSPKIFQLLFG